MTASGPLGLVVQPGLRSDSPAKRLQPQGRRHRIRLERHLHPWMIGSFTRQARHHYRLATDTSADEERPLIVRHAEMSSQEIRQRSQSFQGRAHWDRYYHRMRCAPRHVPLLDEVRGSLDLARVARGMTSARFSGACHDSTLPTSTSSFLLSSHHASAHRATAQRMISRLHDVSEGHILTLERYSVSCTAGKTMRDDSDPTATSWMRLPAEPSVTMLSLPA